VCAGEYNMCINSPVYLQYISYIETDYRALTVGNLQRTLSKKFQF